MVMKLMNTIFLSVTTIPVFLSLTIPTQPYHTLSTMPQRHAKPNNLGTLEKDKGPPDKNDLHRQINNIKE